MYEYSGNSYKVAKQRSRSSAKRAGSSKHSRKDKEKHPHGNKEQHLSLMHHGNVVQRDQSRGSKKQSSTKLSTAPLVLNGRDNTHLHPGSFMRGVSNHGSLVRSSYELNNNTLLVAARQGSSAEHFKFTSSLHNIGQVQGHRSSFHGDTSAANQRALSNTQFKAHASSLKQQNTPDKQTRSGNVKRTRSLNQADAVNRLIQSETNLNHVTRPVINRVGRSRESIRKRLGVKDVVYVIKVDESLPPYSAKIANRGKKTQNLSSGAKPSAHEGSKSPKVSGKKVSNSPIPEEEEEEMENGPRYDNNVPHRYDNNIPDVSKYDSNVPKSAKLEDILKIPRYENVPLPEEVMSQGNKSKKGKKSSAKVDKKDDKQPRKNSTKGSRDKKSEEQQVITK